MPYYVREQHPYCEKCDLRIWRAKCPGCRKGLREEDGYVEIGGEGEGEKKKWHEGCFKCSVCSIDPICAGEVKKVADKIEDSLIRCA